MTTSSGCPLRARKRSAETSVPHRQPGANSPVQTNRCRQTGVDVEKRRLRVTPRPPLSVRLTAGWSNRACLYRWICNLRSEGPVSRLSTGPHPTNAANQTLNETASQKPQQKKGHWPGGREEEGQRPEGARWHTVSRCADGTAYGIRTRVTGVRGRRPRPLDERGRWDCLPKHHVITLFSVEVSRSSKLHPAGRLGARPPRCPQAVVFPHASPRNTSQPVACTLCLHRRGVAVRCLVPSPSSSSCPADRAACPLLVRDLSST